MRVVFKNDYCFGVIILVALVLLFFLPVVAGRQVLFEAATTVFENELYQFDRLKTPWVVDGGTYVRATVPDTIAGVRMIRDGIAPLWTPYSAAGQPLAANMAGGIYNPVRLIFFTVFNSLKAFDWYILLHLFIAGFGMFLYLKALNLDRRAALFGGIAYMFSGYFITNLTFWFLAIDSFVPYVLWALERYFAKPKAPQVALAGIFSSLILLGSHPEVTIVISLFLSGYILARIFANSSLKEQWLFHFRNIAIVIVIGLLISLPMLFDLFTFLKVSYTVHEPPIADPATQTVGTFSFSPLRLLHFMVAPSMILETALASHLFKTPIEFVPYFSIAILLLSIAGFFSTEYKQLRYFFLGFIIFGAMKLAGLPPVSWLGQLPLFEQIAWTKLYGPISLSFAALGAFGLNALINRSVTIGRRFYSVLGAIPLLFILAFVLFQEKFVEMYAPVFNLAQNKAETVGLALGFLSSLPPLIAKLAEFIIKNGWFITVLIFVWATIIFAIILFLLRRYQRTGSQGVIAALIILLVLELWLYMPKIRDGFFKEFNPYKPPPYVSFLQEKAKNEIFRITAVGATFTPHMSELFELQDFRAAPGAYLERYWNFINGYDFSHFHYYAGLVQATSGFAEIPGRLLDAANIKYIISEDWLPVRDDLAIIYNDEVKIYENLSLPGRAYLVFSAVPALDVRGTAQRLADPNLPFNTVVIEQAPQERLAMLAGGEGTAEIENYLPNRVVVKTKSNQPSLLILADAYYQGWQAFVDGKEEIIYPVNALFRGVFLEPGEHEVKFVYEPQWFWSTVLVSLVVFLASLFVIIRPKINKTNETHHK